MKNVNVRLPDHIHAHLKRMAKLDRRSLQEEIIVSLATAVEIFHGEMKRGPGPFNPEAEVWTAWRLLPDGEPSPVKRIARKLSMTPADVAFIVYPAETFGPWEDSQEPDLPA